MSVSPYNIITYYQLFSVGKRIQLYTNNGMIVEGILKQVDSSQNLHITDGKITCYIVATPEGSKFKNLFVMGRDIACFIPGSLPTCLRLTPATPRRGRAPRLRGLGRNRGIPDSK
ncbi:hypothetical protein GE061_000606 [Apolygus lucorum]|uniref:Sm domain-containing protein n=1 Tax=Apolygus lucorum TaxID=248454 RepID=A0A6A4KLI2_APOLU|nr:hypothetical protein GE061_000606 [Apolygus lucorum]